MLGRTDVLDSALVAALRSVHNEIPAGPDYRRLLRESLKHASTVMQLSGQIGERNEAARIRELVQQLGEGQAVLESDAEASGILTRMTRAMLAVNHEETHTRGHYRRSESEFDG